MSDVEDGIFDWVKSGSGLDDDNILWALEQGPSLPVGVFISMELHDEDTFGNDWLTYEAAEEPEAGAEIVVTSQGPRVSKLTLTAWSNGTKWKDSRPDLLLKQVRDSTNLPKIYDTLRAAGVGIGGWSAVRTVKVERSQIFDPCATLEVNIHTVDSISATDTDIKTVTVSATVGELELGDIVAEV